MINKDSILEKKPILNYFEFHLNEHCNLSCIGCGHASNIANKEFANKIQYEKDLNRLSNLFDNIKIIRLMGGEPLLNKDICTYIKLTRVYFPESSIHIVTNGLLLNKMNQNFYDTCSINNISIDLSVYDPMTEELINIIQENCIRNKIKINMSPRIKYFHAHTNLKGDSDKYKAFKLCREKYECNFLKNGYILPCAKPNTFKHLNKKFNSDLIEEEGISIYSNNADEIINFLNTPLETCKFCTYSFIPFKWESHNKSNLRDWDSDTYRKYFKN